jgi:hypothetical protein
MDKKGVACVACVAKHPNTWPILHALAGVQSLKSVIAAQALGVLVGLVVTLTIIRKRLPV